MGGRVDPGELASGLGAVGEDLAVLVDFDGTLAEIVDEPSAARPVEGAVASLVDLTRGAGRVAIVSGRPRRFLVDHVPPSIDLAGLYGLELRIGGFEVDHDRAESWRAELEAAVQDAQVCFGHEAGVVVEPKGLSLTVHFRMAPHLAPAVEGWAIAVADRTSLSVRPAKQSMEVHPPVEADKGTAVERFADGCARVVFIGDDLADLAAFDALDTMRREGRQVLKVAVSSAEVPSDLVEAADAVLDGPVAVAAFLRELASSAAG